MTRAPHRLQFLAAATTDASTAMSSTPRPTTYRGGRNHQRRSFSDRPYAPGRGGHYVSGDSHFRSVREANLGFGRGESGRSFEDSSRFQHSPASSMPERPPHLNQNQQFRPPRFYQNKQFRPPPYNHQNQQYRRSPPFDQNQAQRPPPQFRPRPPDYRNWEFAKAAPPSGSERFTVLSYNILADYLAIDHRSKLYYHIPRYMLDWQWRKRNISFELGLWSTDIMCFQEVDRFQDLEEELKIRGYSGIWKRRTGYPVDGCAIFWRASRFKLMYEESIEFNKLGLRDNVAQICVLELMSQNCNENAAALQPSSTDSKKVVICNIHVLYNPKRGEIKLGQVRMLLDKVHAVSKLWNDAPIILCGDFNCVPKSPLYNYISEQKLDLSGLDRDKLSGQASAEIRVQTPYSPIYGVKSGDNSVPAPAPAPPVVQGSEVVKLNELSLDAQRPYNPDSSLENIPSVENSSHSQPQSSINVNGCDTSSARVKHGTEDGKLHDEMKEETQQTFTNDSSDRSRSTSGAPGAGFREDISTPYGEGGSCTDNFDNEKMSNLNTESFSEHSETNNYIEEGSMNLDYSLKSFPKVSCSTEVKTDAEAYCQTSVSYALEVSSPQNSENPSSPQISSGEQDGSSSSGVAHLSFASASTEVQEKLESLSLNALDETVMEGETIAENSNAFLSALHNTEDTFPCEPHQLLRSGEVESEPSNNASALLNSLQHSSIYGIEDDLSPVMDQEALDLGKNVYDPSLWTPAEIETATGNRDCNFLEHPIKLRSTYTEVEDSLGNRDSNGEPLATSYNRCFFGTVDYIWRSEGLQTVRVLAPIPKHVMQTTPGFPTKKWGSDHIALASELAFVKEESNRHVEVQ